MSQPLAYYAGLPVRASPWLVVESETEREEIGFTDWRERLARNLAGRSTRPWLPLTFTRPKMVPDPHIYSLHGRMLVGHPDTVARLLLDMAAIGGSYL